MEIDPDGDALAVIELAQSVHNEVDEDHSVEAKASVSIPEQVTNAPPEPFVQMV